MRLRRLCTTATLAVALLAPAAAPAAADVGSSPDELKPFRWSVEGLWIELEPGEPTERETTTICPGKHYGDRCEEFSRGGSSRDGLLLRLEYEPGSTVTPIVTTPIVRALDAGCFELRYQMGLAADTGPFSAHLVVVHTNGSGQVTERRVGAIAFENMRGVSDTVAVSDGHLFCDSGLAKAQRQLPPT